MKKINQLRICRFWEECTKIGTHQELLLLIFQVSNMGLAQSCCLCLQILYLIHKIQRAEGKLHCWICALLISPITVSCP